MSIDSEFRASRSLKILLLFYSPVYRNLEKAAESTCFVIKPTLRWDAPVMHRFAKRLWLYVTRTILHYTRHESGIFAKVSQGIFFYNIFVQNISIYSQNNGRILYIETP